MREGELAARRVERKPLYAVFDGHDQHRAGAIHNVRGGDLLLSGAKQRGVRDRLAGAPTPDAEDGAYANGDVDVRGAVQRVHLNDIAVPRAIPDDHRLFDLFASDGGDPAAAAEHIYEGVGCGCIE